MAAHITRLRIESFRGIKELLLDDLSDINIFVGDNNSGKTSALEAIKLLNNPSAYNLLLAARQRERYSNGFLYQTLGYVEAFMYLFHNYSASVDTERYALRVDADINGKSEYLLVSGSLIMRIANLEDVERDTSFPNRSYKKNQGLSTHTAQVEDSAITAAQDMEVQTFSGRLLTSLNGGEYDEPIEINKYTIRKLLRNRIGKSIDIEFIHPFDHAANSSLRSIISNKEMRDDAVSLLKYFEPEITDLRYISENPASLIPVIETENTYMPLSMYGDGMKKALVMLNAIISAKNGVVLIDEFETAIHTSAMNEIFSFLIGAAKKMNTQLFLTTHSIEAVDKLIEAAGDNIYGIRLIRLKNKVEKTYAKAIRGADVKNLRENFNMELRL